MPSIRIKKNTCEFQRQPVYDEDGHPNSWDYIRKIVEKQDETGLKVTKLILRYMKYIESNEYEISSADFESLRIYRFDIL